MYTIDTSRIAFPSPESAVAGSDWDILTAVWGAGPVVKAVMLILLAFSIISWAIIIAKYRQLNRAQKNNADFLKQFWLSPDLASADEHAQRMTFSPAAAIFRQSYVSLSGLNPAPVGDSRPQGISRSLLSREETVRRAVRGALAMQVQRLGQSLSFLATCGNTAPFIGLFGTVWGIMSSFHQIGLKGSASLATVAPGIAEALIATAAGLVAAIPAVIAYNYFLGRVRRLEADLEGFAEDLLELLKGNR
ncbi:MAG: protein TolQ [Deltaproteobacteria bacterium]|nr:protein TolQ [Deltaproteobacteria bacterium]